MKINLLCLSLLLLLGCSNEPKVTIVKYGAVQNNQIPVKVKVKLGNHSKCYLIVLKGEKEVKKIELKEGYETFNISTKNIVSRDRMWAEGIDLSFEYQKEFSICDLKDNNGSYITYKIGMK